MSRLLLDANVGSMFIPLIVAVAVPLFMSAVDFWQRRVVNRQNKRIGRTNFTVRYNVAFFGTMIFSAVLYTCASALFPILYLFDIPDGPPLNVVIGTACGFGVLSVVFWIALFLTRRRKIEVSKDCLLFTPIFGKSREYLFKDIECVKTSVRSYNLRSFKAYVKGNKKTAFSFNSYMVGGDRLAETLERHGLHIIPVTR